MSPAQVISARHLAVDVLNRVDPKRAYAGPVLDRLLSSTDQKQRATDLVFGTLRNRDAMDTITATLSGKPIERISANVLNILRVAVYELAYSPDTPVYSIVNDAVENTRKLAGARQVGFVNAVLRRIAGHIADRKSTLSNCPPTRALPQTPDSGCQFDLDILPDPQSSSQEYLSRAFSLPDWLIARWLNDFGFDTTRRICFGSNRRPTVYIRPNLLRTTATALAEMLRDAGTQVTEIPDSRVMAVRSPHNIRQLPGFEQGLFTVQDLTASIPITALNPRPRWKILDLCAAPGVKTTQIAEAIGDDGTIIATDVDSRRLEMLRQNVARLGITSITAVEHDHLNQAFGETGPFDAILLDVPCSNTGVLAKRIEARHRLTPKVVKDLAETQTGLLATAAKMLKPTGCICYSTCSILGAENADLVRCFLSSHGNLVLEHENLTLPSAADPDHDGGYVAILRSRSNPPE